MRKNLEFFDPDMFKTKPFIIIGSKIDLEDAKKNFSAIKKEFEEPIIPMSTANRINITKFLIYLRSVYDKIPKS